MNISESLKIAIKCIKANWMRSLLTMLGIIIGVGSVIMIVSAGTGARDYIVSLIEDMALMPCSFRLIQLRQPTMII